MLHPYRIPLCGPLTLAGRVHSDRAGLLVELRTGAGVAGWGDVAPLPGFSLESMEEARASVEAVGDALLGRRYSRDEWLEAVAAAELTPAARFGVELAGLDALATGSGKTLTDVIGTAASSQVELNALLMGPREEVVAQTEQALASGYRTLKLKVGRRPLAEDVDRVRAVAACCGEHVALRLDANQAWTPGEAAEFAERLGPVPIAYLEEPLAAEFELGAFAAAYPIPVARDESLVGRSPDASDLLDGVAAIVVKPTLLGGIAATLGWAARARRRGLQVTVSGAFESGVGVRGLVALAAVLPPSAAGLGPYGRIARDVVHPRLDLSPPFADVHALLRRERAVTVSAPV